MQCAIGVGQFVSASFNGHGAVAASLLPLDLLSEAVSQHIGRGRGSVDRGARERAIQASNAEKADLHAELAALASTGMLDGIKKLDREIWELEVPLMTSDGL